MTEPHRLRRLTAGFTGSWGMSDAQKRRLREQLITWQITSLATNGDPGAAEVAQGMGISTWGAAPDRVVSASRILFAAPLGPEEKFPRSQVWDTVRYAERHADLDALIVIMPDGSLDGR